MAEMSRVLFCVDGVTENAVARVELTKVCGK